MSVRDKIFEDMFFQACLEKMSRMVGDMARKRLSKNTPVNSRKIVFMTYNDDYMCNPKSIAEEILRRKLPYELVWIVPKNPNSVEEHFPEEIRLVRRGTYEAFLEMASARVWIDNALDFVWVKFPKKKEQCYIQTWHGSMGIKRIGKNDVKNRRWVKAANLCNRYTDYCVSNSRFENEVYRETYWPDTPILEYGHPRNDILLADDASQKCVRDKVLEFLDIENPEVKLFLYAPTFRDSGTVGAYDVDYEMLYQSLVQRFGGEWLILRRLHYHNRRRGIDRVCGSHVIDASRYPDMQDLMVAADAGMTDYSSWAYDYILMNRPLFLYTVDRNIYDNERGLYFPLESTPFPIAENNEELKTAILQFDMESYCDKIRLFLEEKGCIEDGTASAKVVDFIETICPV